MGMSRFEIDDLPSAVPAWLWLNGRPAVKRVREGELELDDECDALTMTGNGNLCERRMRRAPAEVGGSVTGCASVCEGIAECIARSRMVRAEGVKLTSYMISAQRRCVDTRSGCRREVCE